MARHLQQGLMGKRRRLTLIVLVSVLLSTGLAPFTLFRSTPKTAHAASTSDVVLFIHGFHDDCGIWGNNQTLPALAAKYMADGGWTGSLRTVGYYTWDTNGNCSVDLYGQDHQSACNSYHYSTAANGTLNHDLRNLACQLAWYIYFNYALNGLNVRVVAHSMGGLIIRYALDRVQFHDPAFPPYLWVPVVITMGTPHGGIRGVFGDSTAGAVCVLSGTSAGCLQGAQMTGGTGQPPDIAAFLATLEAETTPPTGGSPIQTTEWTLMGSLCDQYVDPFSATDFPAGPSGVHGTHKIVYQFVPPDAGVNYTCVSVAPDETYDHFQYHDDMTAATLQDAQAYYCDGCAGVPTGSSPVHHSLAVMYRNLQIDAPTPPQPIAHPALASDTVGDTPEHLVAGGDVTGDFKADVLGFYDEHASATSAWVWPSAASTPSRGWESGVNNWYWPSSKFVAGDFNGDLIQDVAGIYDYGNSDTAIFVWPGGPGMGTPFKAWDSGVNNWFFPNSKWVAGDFNGDGRTDLAGIYDYGNGLIGIFIWPGSITGGFGAPYKAYTGCTGCWTLSSSKWVAGDFNGDGKADLAAIYNYGNNTIGVWIWPGTATGLGGAFRSYMGCTNCWSWANSKFVAGDFNGDGRADLAGFYDYGNGDMGVWIWPGVASGLAGPSLAVRTGPGNFYLPSAKFVAGDFNGDGYCDVAALYNYGDHHVALLIFPGMSSFALDTHYVAWDPGPGQWDWSNF